LVGSEGLTSYRAEYFGAMKLGSEYLPLEFKILGNEALRAMADRDPLYRAKALTQGELLLDRTGACHAARKHSGARLASAVEALKREISDTNFELHRCLVQNAFSQAPATLASGNTVSRLCRFSETLLDFYIQVQILIFCKSPSLLESASPAVLEDIVHARGDRGARFLDPHRAEVAPWFGTMSAVLDPVWRNEEITLDMRISRSLEAMDTTFQKIFGDRLLFSSLGLPEVVMEFV